MPGTGTGTGRVHLIINWLTFDPHWIQSSDESKDWFINNFVCCKCQGNSAPFRQPILNFSVYLAFTKNQSQLLIMFLY